MTQTTDPDTPPLLLTVAQLAKYLQLHPQTVYSMARDGRLPHLRIGGSLRFKLADVEQSLRGPEPKDDVVDAGGQP